MAEPVVMSGSSLNTFLRCARQWEYAYVHRLKRPPNLRQALGISAHAAVEADLKHKVATWDDLPKEEVVQTFVDAFHAESLDALPDPKASKDEFLDSGVSAVEVWYDDCAPTVAPILVEQHGQFSLNVEELSIPYDWTADEVDQDTTIRDWKFVSRKPAGGQTYVLNMVGYAIGYREQTGGIEAGVRLDHIVRTKKPYYHPLASGTVADQDIEAFADILASAYRSINAGSFPPNGLKSGACSWCGYNDICPAYREEK